MLFGVQPFIADMTAYALTHEIGTSAAMRASYKTRADLIVEGLSNVPGIVPLPPEAGMFTLINVAGTGLTGEAFAWMLLEQEHVAVMPGASFGNEAASFVRVSLTVPDEVIQEACQRITKLAIRLQTPKERRA